VLADRLGWRCVAATMSGFSLLSEVTALQIHLLVPRDSELRVLPCHALVSSQVSTLSLPLPDRASLLPETLRSLVGNGSIRPSRIYRPLLPLIPRKSAWDSARTSSAVPAPKASGNPLLLFRNVDIIILLCLNAIFNSVLYGVMATLSTALEATYPFLTETTIGLSFLACGGGMTIGSVVNGRVLNREYQTFKRSVGTESRDVYPIERARLRLLPIVITVLAVATAGYGWALQTKVNIAVPLILNIFGQ
jgi:hypothetical protein